MQFYSVFTQLNFPTILTLVRLIFAPIILPILFVHFLPLHNFLINCALALFFVLISLTDFFDGYLARKHNQVTTLGTMLDPIADKFLIFSALIALVAIGRLYFFWAIVLIGREFFVMTLRHIALECGLRIHVSGYGKLKTVLQILLITFLVLSFSNRTLVVSIIEYIFILATVVISLWSAWKYGAQFLSDIRYRKVQ